MKKLLLMVAIASVAFLADSHLASARGRCGGGRGGRHGGCGGGGGCGGMMMGGCGMGGCGMMMGGCGMGGCGMMMGGHGGYLMGGGAYHALATGTEATLIVSLPADATLTIDGEETNSTSAQRVFVTPALEEGKEYEYTLKAKLVHDGETKIATAKVTFRSGETKQVELKVRAAGVAAQ